jgi:hypothetical protein
MTALTDCSQQDTRSISPPTRLSSTFRTPPCTTLPHRAVWLSHMEREVLVPLGLALVLLRLVLVELGIVEVGLLVVSLMMVLVFVTDV